MTNITTMETALQAIKSSNVCQKCYSMLQHPLTEMFTYKDDPKSGQPIWQLSSPQQRLSLYHAGMEELKTSSCPLCFQIWFKLSQVEKEEKTELVFSQICTFQQCEFAPGSDETLQLLFLDYDYSYKTDLLSSFGYLTLCPIYDPLSVPKYWLRPGIDIRSTASIDFEPWLENCLNNHNCAKSKVDDYIPPRLLEYDDNSVRLINGTDLIKETSSSVDYAALSYCWGPTPTHLTLTTTNMAALEGGVPLSTLPRTFLDAIQVCRRVKIKYLWIDSVCIIQAGDQQKDWLKHVSQMDTIYGSCWLQISAAHSVDANGGCFSDRPPSALYPAVIPPVKLGKGIYVSKSIYRKTRLSRFCLPDDEKLMRAHLLTRGWVFQERLLSPRTLYYDSDDVYMECHEELICSSIPENFRAFNVRRLEADARDEFPILKRPPYDWHPFNFRGDNIDPLLSWVDLTSSYSKCQLTRIEDKLVAFSSIAKRVCGHGSDDYVAGFPRELLPAALVWRREREAKGPINSHSSLVIAPTWSWAHIDGSIEYPNIDSFSNRNWKIETTVVATNIDLLDASQRFGLMKSASITVSGPILKVNAVAKNDTTFDLKGGTVEIGLEQRSYQEDLSGLALNTYSGVSRTEYPKAPYAAAGWTLDRKDVRLSPESASKWLWLVIQTERRNHNSEFKRGYCGIILEQANEPDKHVRVGYFDFEVTKFEKRFGRGRLVAGIEVREVTII